MQQLSTFDSQQLNIVSWNINGLRAVWSKGFGDWLKSENPHLLGLQEIKCQEDQVAEILEAIQETHQVTLVPAQKKGYSGVALLHSHQFPPERIETELGLDEFDCEGRTVIAYYPNFIVINSYYPNGQRDHGRVPYKLRYSRAVLKRALELEKAHQRPVILMGDFNTAHHPYDLANPESNKKTTGFLPEERVFLDECLTAGYRDLFREQYPEEPGHYTWWTYRNQCRERNIGWRIDYILFPQTLAKKVSKVEHLTDVLGSDHCPVKATLKLDA